METREKVARIIDPASFANLASEQEWAMKHSKPESFWLLWKKRRDKALEQADAIIVLLNTSKQGQDA